MKLRYQLRGLGIGMVVTAIIMGVATGHGIPLTDAEIRARALELGMVESNSLKLSDVAGMSGSVSETEKNPGTEEKDKENSGGMHTGEPDVGASDGTGPEDTGNPDETQPGTSGQENPEEGQAGEPDVETLGGVRPEDAGDPDEGQQGEPGIDNREEMQPGEPEAGNAVDSLAHFVLNGDIVTVIIEPGADSYTISRALAEAGLVEDAGEYDNYLCTNMYSRKIVNGNYEIPLGTTEEEIAKIITLGR